MKALRAGGLDRPLVALDEMASFVEQPFLVFAGQLCASDEGLAAAQEIVLLLKPSNLSCWLSVCVFMRPGMCCLIILQYQPHFENMRKIKRILKECRHDGRCREHCPS